MLKKIFLLFIFFFGLGSFLFAQDGKTLALAKQYYQTGDYEKAAQLFDELWKEDPANDYYYSSLLNSLVRLKKYDEAEAMVKKQIKKNKENTSYPLDLGFVYTQNNQAKEAEKIFDDAIANLPAEQGAIRSTANKFITILQTDYAVKTYLRGRELLRDKTLFGYELGNLYLQNNKIKDAVSTYLGLIEQNSSYKDGVQNILANNIDKEGMQEELEEQLYTALQKHTNNDVYPEMLIWLFTHQGDYGQALVQAKALDKRNSEEGGRIISLADNALQEKQYTAAIDAYDYLLNKNNSAFKQQAISNKLKAQKLKVTETNTYTQTDLQTLQTEYENYVSQYGKNLQSVNAQRDLANLEAYYIHNMDKAIGILNDILALPQLPKKTKNEVKLDLGDYYVLDGDVWEATLLYAQVDKDEKDSPLGEDARFRNAKLSYYKGEFEWAQAQLDILKGATTELISNNAIELSVFIMDNLGLDTTKATMQAFADADLLHLQNKDEEAQKMFSKILLDYPEHTLADEVLYEKAKIFFENKQYDKAAEQLKIIEQKYAEDILADNAIFMLGDIYEKYLGNTDKAMEYYKKIITDYSDSVLLVEARKRFRILRGDEL